MSESLKSYISRIESLEEARADIASDIKDIYNEAGAKGFDKKALRKAIAARKIEKEEREKLEELVELYLKEAEES